MADDKDEGRMLIALNALIEGQKRTLRMVETAIERYSTLETELTKVNRKLNAAHELALRNHGEISQRIDAVNDLALRNYNSIMTRLDAIAARLEEVERLEDDRAGEIKKIHIELSSQYNDILSALQMAWNSVADVNDFRARLEQLERRLGI